MDPVILGVIGTFFIFFLLFLGMPIAFALMLVGFLGISYLASIEAALPVAARTVYEVSAYYPYTVISLHCDGGLRWELRNDQRFVQHI